MIYLLITLYALSLGVFAWRRFEWAVCFFAVILPTYLIRLTIGPLPTTLLEISFGALLLVWLLHFARKDFFNIKQFVAKNTFLSVALGVFFLSSVAGILVSDQWYISLGQWRAYFLEPLLLFVMLVGRGSTINVRNLLLALVAGTIPVSLVAVGQKFFPMLYPPSLWDDQTFGRVTSFFTTPNAIPLFTLPPLFAGVVLVKDKSKKIRIVFYAAVLLGILALALSKSFGGILALGAGILVLVYFLYSKRLSVVTAAVSILVMVLGFSFLPTIKMSSMQNRFTLWHHSIAFLTRSPKNFVLGAGIRQYFRKIEKPYYNPKELERLIYPHNIIFNFWAEIGLFGVLGFLGIFGCLKLATLHLVRTNVYWGAATLAALAVFFVHGLVDVPYFKNDLAFLFWMLAATVTLSAQRVNNKI